jgi:hypothetical protein
VAAAAVVRPWRKWRRVGILDCGVRIWDCGLVGEETGGNGGGFQVRMGLT